MAPTQLTKEEEEQLYYFYHSLAHQIIRDTVLYQPFVLEFMEHVRHKAEGQLKRFWYEAWTGSSIPKKPAMHDFTCSFRTEGEYEIVLFTFPEPVWMTNAWMSAAIREQGAETYRYLTLEDTMKSTPESPQAVLCEWTVDAHTNYGTYTNDVCDQDSFIKSALEVIRS